ncbi:aminotransferase class-V family protein [Chlamydia ibidis]|uniref:Aminotransferase class-V family protein n=2 Tax=Chlamydia ibidis TaxID=1405396 RepID=S7KHH9_9CHLA|nr:cysteine desulfurase family protein [Chlamydia ibidis]EPP35626.1 aminotransferase class-V family protein [Chlamydia ibidis]EQM62666.1 aminotransferase class-V family protein [Chlamydia ibidis 10-1398/6]
MIYLDNNAMAPLAPGLLEFLHQLFSDRQVFANPSSVHSPGKYSRQIIRETTELIQEVLGFSGQVLYTSGATESLNLAITSLKPGSHVITSSMEHPAIIETLKHANLSVTYLDPEIGQCALTPKQIEDKITPQTSAIVLGWANSEIGAKTDITAIGEIACKHNLCFIVDATAIVGREKIVIPKSVTMTIFSGHKFHAMSGIGVLLITPKNKITPMLWGGGQQNGLRSGTENLWGIASLLYVFNVLKEKQEEIAEKIASYRDHFEKSVKSQIPEVIIHCEDKVRVNNVSAIAFPPLEGEVMQIALDVAGVACGYGSACSSGATTAFKSLVAMQVEPNISLSTLRFSFSYLLTFDDINRAVDIIVRVSDQLKHAWL